MDTLKYTENEDYLRLFSLKEIIQSSYYAFYTKTSKKLIKNFNDSKSNFLDTFNKSFINIEKSLANDIDTQCALSIVKLLLYPINKTNKLSNYSDYNINILFFKKMILNNYNMIEQRIDDLSVIESFTFDDNLKLNSFYILRNINGIKYKYDETYQITSMIFIDGSEMLVNN